MPLTYTLGDAKNEVYLLTRGPALLMAHLGDIGVELAISRAQQSVLQDIPELEVAGALYTSASIAVVPGQDIYTFPNGLLVPKAMEVSWGVARLVRARMALQAPKVSQLDTEALYAFMGTQFIVRPIPASGTMTLHYIAAPEDLISEGQVLPLSPLLFPAVCKRAAWACLAHIPGIDSNELSRAQSEYAAELQSVRNALGMPPMEDFAAATGRSPVSGPQAAGSGAP